MATTDQINEALNKFLAFEQPSVLAIKGAWGVGKTYFWNRFIEKTKAVKNCRVRSYVSLFGISTLPELRRAIFTRQDPFAGQSGAIGAAKKYTTTLLRNVEVTLGPIKNTDAWAGIIEDKALRNYIVCIDDLERKEAGLSPSALLGFIAELRDERKCKVVLLYNDDEVAKDKELAEALAEYREKVIDRELTFNPTVSDSYGIIFRDEKYMFGGRKKLRSNPFYPSDERELLEIFESIGTANIRVMHKTRDALEYFSNEMSAYPRQWPAFARQAVKACCLHYIHGRDFKIEDALDQNRALRAYISKNEKESKENEKYAPVEKVGYFPGETDDLILEYLRFGYVDWPRHKSRLVKAEERLVQNQLRQKLEMIWDKIWDNFEASQEEFNADMSAFLIKNRAQLGLRDVSSATSVLREFGGETLELKKLQEEKINEFADSLSEGELDELHLHTLNRDVVEKIWSRVKAKVVKRPISEVVTMMTKEGGWNPRDLRYIKDSSAQDFYVYLKSSREKKFFSRIKRFRERLGGDGHAGEISVKLDEALTKLAGESAINARRIQYGVGFTIPASEAR